MVNVDILLKKGELEIILEKFRRCSGMDIVNVSSLEGLKKNKRIMAIGFARDGKPVILTDFQSETKVQIPICGGKTSAMSLGDAYVRGRSFDKRKIFGFEAISSYLGISPNKIKMEVQRLADSGITSIYVRRLSNTFGLSESYGLFEDKWIFSASKFGKKEQIDYDAFWHELLKKIGSEWRLLTEGMKKYLEKRQSEKMAKFVKKASESYA